MLMHKVREGRDRCVLYQEEHPGLHDLPGELHQDTLFQVYLEHNSKLILVCF